MSKHRHYAGSDHVVPEPGTPGWKRVVARGCGGSVDYWGEFDCDHGYTWSCDDCPWRVQQDEDEEAWENIHQGPPEPQTLGLLWVASVAGDLITTGKK